MFGSRAAASLLRARAPALRAAPVRRMGGGGHGHAHEAPQYTGFEAKVRKYLPENVHIVYAVLGTYAVLITVSKIRSGSAKAAAIAKTPAPAAPDYHTPIVVSSDIPGFGTPEWEEFINKDSNNFQVWLEHQFKE